MNQRNRTVVLYVVLAALVSSIVLSAVTRQPVPSEVYAALGAIGGYVLLRGGDGKDDDEKDRDEKS